MSADAFANRFAAIQRADDDRDPAYLDFVEALARELASTTDRSFVQLGALAVAATEPRAGHQRMTIVELSGAIGVGRSALSQYRSAVIFYQGYADTAALLDEMPNISFAHLRSAMRLKNLDDARKILADWSGREVSTNAAHIEINERIGKPVPEKPLFDGGAVIEALELRPGGARMTVELAVGDFDVAILDEAIRSAGGRLLVQLNVKASD